MKREVKLAIALAIQTFLGINNVSAQEIYGGQLDSVVVQVAYGAAKKSTITGAVSQIESKNIERHAVTDPLAALEGETAGVNVSNTWGVPGVSSTIYVRGYGTVTGANDSAPIFIIDGVELGSNTIDINPDDIESISVLKDAASAALYGNRGAHGVVLITTKRGKGGKMKLTFKTTQGTYSRAIKDYNTLDAKQFMEASWASLRNSYMTSNAVDMATANAYASAHLIPDELKLNIFDKPYDALFDSNGYLAENVNILPGYAEDLDWMEQGTHTGYRQTYGLSGSQSSKYSDCYFSISDLNEKGYLPNSDHQRITARLNFDTRPANWISTGLKMAGSYQDNNQVEYSAMSAQSLFRAGRMMSPIYPVHLHNADGSYLLDSYGNKQYDTGRYTDANGNSVDTRAQYEESNSIWQNQLDKKEAIRYTIQTIAYADIRFLNDFTFTVKGSLDLRHTKASYYYNSIIGQGYSVNGRLQQISSDYKTHNFQQQLKWNHAFGNHTASILLGHENLQYKQETENSIKSNEAVYGSTALSQYSNMEQMRGVNNMYRTESYFGRVRYNYLDRYNLEGCLRRDGSSRFANGHRWGTFGSIGANWVVSREKFMESADWVNHLLLRTDYGVAGSDAAGGYNDYEATYFVSQNGNRPAYILRQLGNENLKWEKGESYDIAIEARLFNRWNITAEYFNKTNKDLLFEVRNPLSAGGTGAYNDFYSKTTQNVGSVRNKGFELSTDIDILRNKNWRVNLSTNATFIKNEVTKLPDANKAGLTNTIYKLTEGKSVYEFYTYSYVGVDQMTGKALYKADLENNKVLAADGTLLAGNPDGANITNKVVCIDGKYYVNQVANAMKEFHGTALPKVYGGFRPSVSYKSLSFSALFTFSLGAKIYDSVYKELMSSSTSPHNYHADILNSWNGIPEGMTEDSPNRIWKDGIPQINSYTSGDNNAESSRWITSANYISLKNIHASYVLPQQWISKLGIAGVKVNLSCENVFISAKRRGIDPKQNVTGYQNCFPTTPRVFTVDVEVKL